MNLEKMSLDELLALKSELASKISALNNKQMALKIAKHVVQ